jgi:hypothetical protein
MKQDHVKEASIFWQAEGLRVANLDLLPILVKRKAGRDHHLIFRA